MTVEAVLAHYAQLWDRHYGGAPPAVSYHQRAELGKHLRWLGTKPQGAGYMFALMDKVFDNWDGCREYLGKFKDNEPTPNVFCVPCWFEGAFSFATRGNRAKRRHDEWDEESAAKQPRAGWGPKES